jgi:hypothetical protein
MNFKKGRSTPENCNRTLRYKPHYNITIRSTHRSSKWSLSFMFSYQNLVGISLCLPCMVCDPVIPYSLWPFGEQCKLWSSSLCNFLHIPNCLMWSSNLAANGTVPWHFPAHVRSPRYEIVQGMERPSFHGHMERFSARILHAASVVSFDPH